MREAWQRADAAITLGAAEAAELLRPALGDVAVAALEPLGGGKSNTNIRVRLSGAPHDVVLRLYQRDPGQMRKEAALSRRLAGQVPVPVYRHCGTRPVNGAAYAVVAWIEGRPLEAMARGAGESDLRFAGHEVGRVLAAIHGVTFAQAGFLDGDLNIHPFPGGSSSAGFLATTFEGIAGERLGRPLAAEVVAFAEANEHRLAAWSQPPRLTHFDFGGSNILLRDDFSVAAVVDWEFAASASPPPDFGNLLRPPLGLSTAFVEGVADGYRAAGGFLPEDWRALTRLADMSAWADFLSRPFAGDALIADAQQILRQTIAPVSGHATP
ncbi:MAG: phosphotransferase [Rhizomicrobium sp.]